MFREPGAYRKMHVFLLSLWGAGSAACFNTFLMCLMFFQIVFCSCRLAFAIFAFVILQLSFCNCYFAIVVLPLSFCKCHFAFDMLQLSFCNCRFTIIGLQAFCN